MPLLVVLYERCINFHTVQYLPYRSIQSVLCNTVGMVQFCRYGEKISVRNYTVRTVQYLPNVTILPERYNTVFTVNIILTVHMIGMIRYYPWCSILSYSSILSVWYTIILTVKLFPNGSIFSFGSILSVRYKTIRTEQYDRYRKILSIRYNIIRALQYVPSCSIVRTSGVATAERGC